MKSKDRLAELRHLSQNAGVYHDTVESAAPLSPSPHAAHIDTIFQEVERMRNWIHELNGNTQLMRRLHADPTFHTNKHLQEQLESVVLQWNAVGLKVCGALRQLEARTQCAGGGGGAGARIARLQLVATRSLYADSLTAHLAALEELRGERLALLQRQIHLTNLAISDEQCQSLLDSNDIALFVDNVRADTADARRALREVEARHGELARVEGALRDVRDLFAHVAHLVAAQQDRLDSVEYFALQATDHVEGGHRHLLKGSVSRTKARKKQLSLLLCLSAGLLVVLLVLLLT